MSAQYYEVTKVKHAGQREGKFGTLDKYYCEFSANGTPYTDVYWQRKPGNAPEVGQTYFGEIKEGEFGPRFHQEQDPSQTPSAPAQSQASTQSPAPPIQGTEDARQPVNEYEQRDRRIVRQHSQEMALRLLAQLGISDTHETERIQEQVRFWTDHFEQDVRP